jgi:hypothetical protein
LAAQFIPAADDSGLLWGGNDSDPEAALFKKIKNQGHYGKDPHPDAHGAGNDQGYYAATPSGVLLASSPATDAAGVIKMLQEALAKWQKLPQKERLLAEVPARRPAGRNRANDQYPEGGLVLTVYLRDLPRQKSTKDHEMYKWTWNVDHAWFTKDDARALLPAQPEKGATHPVPDRLIRRLARATLIDNVRSITPTFADSEVEKARLTATVTAVDGGLVSLRFEGETRTSASGVWAVGQEKASPQKRGYESRLLGRAVYDLKNGKFTSFDLAAVGTRWGGTVYNGRTDDLDPAPMGFALTLAGDSPADRLAPFAFTHGGWH